MTDLLSRPLSRIQTSISQPLTPAVGLVIALHIGAVINVVSLLVVGQITLVSAGISIIMLIALGSAFTTLTLKLQERQLHTASHKHHNKAEEQPPGTDFDELASIAADLYWHTDLAGFVTSAGGRMMPRLVSDLNEIIGHHYLDLIEMDEAEADKMFHALENGTPYSDIHSIFKTRDGAEHVFSLSATPRLDKAGEISGYLGVGTDVSERVAAQRKLKHLADHDALTGLANRRAFSAWISRDLNNCDTVGIFAIDLDDFKGINDTYGHDIGDEVLCQVAERLTSVIRKTDWAARLGGDEFIFVSPNLQDHEDASIIAERVKKALSQTYTIETLSLNIQASIGIAIAPDHADIPERLMKCADLALYEAKTLQRGGFVLFESSLARGRSALN